MNSGIMEAYSMRRHSAKVIPKQPGNARFRAQLAIQGKATHLFGVMKTHNRSTIASPSCLEQIRLSTC